MQKRFSGKTGKEYELFFEAVPHFEMLQQKIGEILTKFLYTHSQNIFLVLEIGCGSGYTTDIILKSDERVRVVGIDNETKMIEQAMKNEYQYIKNNRLVLLEKDAFEFLKNQKSGSFDAFVSAFTLHNFKKNDRRIIIEEIFRVLKKGGIFINADKYALDDEEEHQKTLQWQLQKFQEIYLPIGRHDLEKEWRAHYLEDDAENVRMEESFSLSELKHCGFINPQIVYREQMEAIIFTSKSL